MDLEFRTLERRVKFQECLGNSDRISNTIAKGREKEK